jgi:hypothetical protein
MIILSVFQLISGVIKHLSESEISFPGAPVLAGGGTAPALLGTTDAAMGPNKGWKVDQ